MLLKSQKPWVPGSLDSKPPAPPVKPPWQARATLLHAADLICNAQLFHFFAASQPPLQPIPIVRKLETTSRDGEIVHRTHPGPPNLGDRFRHAFLADPLHDRHVKPPSLAKPNNKFTPDLAR
jgi:hypothetical protein